MSGRAAQIDQSAKAAQVERRDDVRRTEQPEPVHSHEKLILRLRRLEEVREDRAIPTECLLPTMCPVAHRVFQIGPQPPGDFVAVVDVAGQPERTRCRQIGRRRGRVFVSVAVPHEKLQPDAGVDQPFERVWTRWQIGSQVGQSLGACRQGIEDSQRHRGEHRLRAAKRFDQVENVGGIGCSHRSSFDFLLDEVDRPNQDEKCRMNRQPARRNKLRRLISRRWHPAASVLG